MATATRNAVAKAVRAVAPDATDRDLLARFAAGDEAAFAAVVQRHAGLVLGVCRRVLPTVQDAEDATQAVFLVLAKQAAGGRWQPSIANWLYTTARRVAAKANRTAHRRTKRESRPAPAAVPSALDQMTGREAFAALDAELDRLPPTYREPLVLCHLQGLTRDEAAARLGVPVGTVKTRLERGRKRLADALTKRGVVLGAGLLAVAATSPAGASPPALVSGVLAAVHGSPSPAVAALADGGFPLTTLVKRSLLVTLLAFGLLGTGIGFTPQVPAANADDKPKAEMTKPKEEKKPGTPQKPTRVGGTVTGPDGKAVGGAEVFVWYLPGGEELNEERVKTAKVGATDDAGKFAAELPKDASEYFQVYVTKAGLGVAWARPDYPARTFAEPTKLALKMPADLPIKGKVVDTEGKPAVGVAVNVFTLMDPTDRDMAKFLKAAANGGFGTVGQWDDPLHPPAELFATTTAKDGTFEVKGVGDDRIVGVAVHGKGIARMSGLVLTRKGVDVTALNKQQKEPGNPKGRHAIFYGPEPTLVVEPGYSLEGAVTAKATGKPVAGCSLTLNTGHWDRLTTRADTDGKYRFDGLTKGMDHYLNVNPPKAAEVFPLFTDITPGDGYKTVTKDIALPSGAVFAGKVIDKETKQPVAAEFQFIPDADNPFAKKPEYESASRDMTWKGNASTFRIVTIPGKCKVNVQVNPTGVLNGVPYHEYVIGKSITIDLKEGANAETVVEVERGKTATVKVVDADGKPASGLVVAGQVVNDYGLAGEEWPAVVKQAADASEFTVYGLAPGKKRTVVVVVPGKKLAGVTTVSAGETAEVKLLPLQPLRGTFTDPDGTPLAGVSVNVEYVFRLDEVFRDHLTDWKNSAVSDKSGAFEIPDVIPGTPLTFGARKGDVYYRGTPRLGTKTVTPGKPLDLGTRKLEEFR